MNWLTEKAAPVPFFLQGKDSGGSLPGKVNPFKNQTEMSLLTKQK
jgi:hypothetical protein